MKDVGYDVIVVGSGVCGAVTAWRLAQGRAKVLLLEAGETGPPRIELVGAFARAPVKTPGSPYAGRRGDQLAPGPETRPDYYRSTPSTRFRSTYLRRTGGSTWHFLGNVPRFVPSDFRLHSLYGVGRDWPLTYDDLEPDYCDAERLIGVSGDHAQWNGLFGARRSEPFPMTKIWESYSDRKVAPAIESIVVGSIPLRVMNTPQARNSRAYDGRPPCAGNSTCVPICPIQAKYDGTVHVKKAIAAGVEFRDQAVVTAIDLGPDGRQVSGVRYRTWDGVEVAERARLVVIAAHAVETAKLLLASRGASGIANSSDQVGRNLMDHPQGAGGCLSPEPLFPFRGPPTTSGIDALRDGAFRKEHAAFRMSLGNDGWGARIEPPAKTVERFIETERLFGGALRTRVREHLTRQFRISFSTELLPDPENRVTLSADRDALGIPMPALRLIVPEYSLKAFQVARGVIDRIFQALGGTDIVFSPSGDEWTGAGHIMGTCRMGDNPRQSVVDPDGRCHDHPNLFIVGASVFPTCGTANPTLTALALAVRASRAMADHLAKGLTP